MDYNQKMKKIRDTLYDIPIEIPEGLLPPDDFTRGVILGFKIGFEMGKQTKTHEAVVEKTEKFDVGDTHGKRKRS